MTRVIGKKEFMVLGKLLVKKRPEIAEELLPSLDSVDNETNRSFIPIYYQQFCKLRSSDITDPSCRLNKFQKGKERKIFIAAILRLYVNQVFQQSPGNALFPKDGLSKQLADLFNITKGGICHIIRQVLYDHRNYELFRNEVDTVVSSLKSMQHGKTETIEN